MKDELLYCLDHQSTHARENALKTCSLVEKDELPKVFGHATKPSEQTVREILDAFYDFSQLPNNAEIPPASHYLDIIQAEAAINQHIVSVLEAITKANYAEDFDTYDFDGIAEDVFETIARYKQKGSG